MDHEISKNLEGKSGDEFWRSLEELADTEEFRTYLAEEFPRQSRPLSLEIDRRKFLILMGGALAMAGLTGCRFLPQQKIVPYVNSPEDIVPGLPLYYATGMTLSGYGVGLVATSNMGRPIKLDGNSKHPSSLGGSDPLMQASILNMYDPDRSQTVMHQGRKSDWKSFTDAMRGQLSAYSASGGEGMRLLTGTVASPTLKAQIDDFLKMYPKARWHQYEPINRDSERKGGLIAYGRDVHPVYHFDKAERILSIGADFLGTMPGHTRYALDFANARRLRKGSSGMNRLYCVESSPTITGAMADHKFPLKPSELYLFALGLASKMGVIGQSIVVPTFIASWVDAVMKDMVQSHGKAVVVIGDEQPPELHALGYAMNDALGSFGATLDLINPIQEGYDDQAHSLKSLTDDILSGKVRALFIVGGNPAYNAPSDIDFSSALTKLSTDGSLTVHLSNYRGETSILCQWHIPETHFLETWGDTRGHDGTLTPIQPLIQPLFDSHSAYELMSVLCGKSQTGYDIVHERWKSMLHAKDFETDFNLALNDGLARNSSYPPLKLALKNGWEKEIHFNLFYPAGELEVLFRPDPSAWDGEYGNNSWLQELPKPLSKIVWDNPVYVSPNTARALGVAENDVVSLTLGERTITGPISVIPGHADGCVTLFLGYGRTTGGKVCEGRGYNAYLLRSSQAMWQSGGLTITNTGGKHQLVSVRVHYSMEGRDVAHMGTLAQFLINPQLVGERTVHENNPETSLYPQKRRVKSVEYAWAMSIDTNLCIGCNACVTACQAENNIPVVGREQVALGRELHWIRIDTYYKGAPENPSMVFEPIPCMQCEDAPCEPVCPVGATVHSKDGLNQQVYNRCVGTRYCSHNCPYKVRRFNFYKYSAGQPNHAPGEYDNPIMQLLANPDVTIRGRGVMEKCTYCVQRINRAKINAQLQDREVRDGEIVTACQSACPTKAIVFGNLNDPKSEVSQLKAEPQDFSLLGELNTHPRTTYLPRVRNVNPEIPPSTGA
jgi:MoCo/4Fe-4S cofactor protein with predicted Tat translocation signal